MKKTIHAYFWCILSTLIVGCASSPPQGHDVSAASFVSATPDLSRYVRLELYAQNAGPTEQPLEGQMQFLPGSAQFEVSRTDGTPMGRLHVQPESCRDDPNPYCLRSFVINGRLQAKGANLSCTVPVRNDVNVGYLSQTLSGLCQSQYGRSYTLQMSAR
jgi:hypothetical protein